VPEDSRESLKVFMQIPLFLLDPKTTLAIMLFLYLSTDSLIAFKSAALTTIGIYFITFLKLLYKDGRPFWISAPIYGMICEFDFSGPAYHLFILTFFYVYIIVMYCLKYARVVNKTIVGSLFAGVVLLGAWALVGGVYTGTIYIY
jgi:hypothetical protein